MFFKKKKDTECIVDELTVKAGKVYSVVLVTGSKRDSSDEALSSVLGVSVSEFRKMLKKSGAVSIGESTMTGDTPELYFKSKKSAQLFADEINKKLGK